MHHLVYVTTNIENKKFYIGKHSTNKIDDGYYGSGIWVKRAKKKKAPLVTRVIADCNSEAEAYAKEYELIVLLKQMWSDLCMNIADGGVGFSVSYPSNRSGELAPMYGKKHSDDTKKRLSELNSARFKENHPMLGKKHSEESKNQMSATHLKIGYLRGKKVKSLTTGKVYLSLSEAARDVANDSRARSNIRACIEGKISYAYGNKWCFIKD